MVFPGDQGQAEITDRQTVSRRLSNLVLGTIEKDRAGTSIFLEGPPGIGKSFLIEDLLRSLPDKVPVLRAAGDHRRRNDPFSAIAQMIGTPPASRDPSDVAFDRVDDLCSTGPALVWLDDAHHADAGSLTVLRRLVWASRDLPLVVLITARPMPVREQVDILVRQVQHRLQLPPMDKMSVERMVFDRTGRWPGVRLRQSIGSAAGNPLFVVELIRALEKDCALVPYGVDIIDVDSEISSRAAGLDAVIREHLRQLDESAFDLLAALAVCGTSVSTDDLAALTYTAAADLQAPVARAIASGVAHHVATDTIDFSHDLYREVLYGDLSLTFRQATHRRVATLLAQDGRRPSLVAEHLLQATSIKAAADPDTLAALTEAASESRLFAPEVAADLLAEAEATGIGDKSDGRLYERLQDLFLAGRGELADQLIRERIRGVRNPDVAAGMQTLLIRSLVNRAETDAAVATIERTAAIPGLPAPILNQMQSLRLWVLLLAGRPPSAGETAALLTRFAAAADRPAQASLMVTMACAEHVAGRTVRALELLGERSPLVTDQQEWQSRSTALVWPANFELWVHGPAAGRQAVEDARRLSTERAAHWVDSYLGAIAGGAALIGGDWDDAVAELDTALELAVETGTGWISIPVGIRAYIDAHRGDTGAARLRLEAFRHSGRPLQFGQNHPGLAELAVLEAEGSTRSAGQLARTLWSAARRGPANWAGFLAPDVTRAAIAALDRQLAAQIDDDLRSRAAADGTESVTTLVHGMVTGSADEISSATQDFAAAGRRTWEYFGYEELACAAAAAGDKNRALEALDAALAGYQRMRTTPDRDRVLARMRALGIRRGPRGAHRTVDSGWGSLTATENRIAALVQTGLTNRQVATQLFISPRTVQTHVSHILAKTGLTSRVEVAAAAHVQP
jgi:DNA-binding CsgD family transcriptional regulator